MFKVKRTERGWAGHFIGADGCMFRRNTLLECRDIKIVVSTVGNWYARGSSNVEEIGYKRYYETMAFHSDPKDTRYHDACVSKQVYFQSTWAIHYPGADDSANEMHEEVVAEITQRLRDGERFEAKDE